MVVVTLGLAFCRLQNIIYKNKECYNWSVYPGVSEITRKAVPVNTKLLKQV